jgi:hypothetical protein
MVASITNDLVVQSGGQKFSVRLADAGKIAIEPYNAGFKSGVKITLARVS